MSFDISHAIQAKSDQINAADLVEPMMITIVAAKAGDAQQKVVLETQETPGRAYKPAKTVLRILAKLWGVDAAQWVGKQLVIFNDPTVTYAGEAVGGIRVSHMSHIDGEKTITVRASRQKYQKVVIKPLQAQIDWGKEIEAANGDHSKLKTVWEKAHKARAPQEIFDTITAIVEGEK